MEYLQGGDLMTLLMKKDILTEDETRFYIAQILLAIESVHKMNYIHRDLKPDNILLDRHGHVKLSDFGLCKHSDIKESNPLEYVYKEEVLTNLQHIKQSYKRKLAFSTVGTPDYIAPEIFS